MSRMHVYGAAVVAALAAAALAVAVGIGSSHREAPLSSLDPTGDDTDLYAFTAKDAPGALTVVANWIPFEDPAGGPNFYKFDSRARYYINVDNTGDGAYDVRYRFTFRDRVGSLGDAGYVTSLPQVTSLDDPELVFRQTGTVVRETYNGRGRKTGSRVLTANLPVAPNNVGPKTMPDYESLWPQAIRSLPGGGKAFAGQRDDPFFLPLGRIFDSVNLEGAMTGNVGGGVDDLAGFGVHSVVLQVPESAVTRDRRAVSGADDPEAAVGVWASTERRRLQVTNEDADGRGDWVQVSRLGNPLINELVIPYNQKDKFNRTQPQDDLRNFGRYALKPFPAAALNQLFQLGIKEDDRTDIVQALLTGIPGVTAIGSKPAPADTLKINLGVPPADQENRVGVIGGDNAGFPNGRRLADDIVDITLRVVGGYLVPENQGGKKLPLGDGVDVNDQAFLPSFPYVPSLKNPGTGPAPTFKRQEPVHDPTPAESPR